MEEQQTLLDSGRPAVPRSQTVLLLHEPRQPYSLTGDYQVPALRGEGEVLVRVRAIGLNPIDWKAPDYNFGLPQFPYISGREFSGDVVLPSGGEGGDWASSKDGSKNRVIAISTDYRDIRKGAYQEFAVALDYNLVTLPPQLSYEQGSTVGVAFVAAALGLGVSLGLDFSSVADGPDLFRIVRSVAPNALPEDVRQEALQGIREDERPKAGDWLAVWGGSATSANMAIQMAKLAGLRVVVVIDHAKHGAWLSDHATIRPDVVVDSHDAARATDVVRRATNGRARYGLDTRGRETATHLLRALLPEHGRDGDGDGARVPQAPPTPPATPKDALSRAHVVGMTGLPRWDQSSDYLPHSVPIKLFHEVREVGRPVAEWLGRLLERQLIVPPDILGVEEGLGSVNGALDRMRRGEISAGKLVVRV